MFRLLELLPSAKLVDMFVSEEIDRIFDKVRDEFNVRNPPAFTDSGTQKKRFHRCRGYNKSRPEKTGHAGAGPKFFVFRHPYWTIGGSTALGLLVGYVWVETCYTRSEVPARR